MTKKFKDNEDEMDRFIKGLSLCRNCSHVRIAHKNACLDGAFNKYGAYNACKCNNFLPQDNLEYIEFMYNKKGDKK